jgi:predicted MFS family arabinose efflux permease
MFVPLGLGFSLGSAVSRRLARRVAASVPVVGCATLAAVLLAGAAIATTPESVQPPLLVAMIGLAGIGQGLVVAPLVAGLLGRVGPADAGAVSGMAATATQLGLALGVAVAGSWYRLVLGAPPGQSGVPFADHATAFAAAAVLLAALATATSLLSRRLHRLPAPPTEPESKAASITAAAPSS